MSNGFINRVTLLGNLGKDPEIHFTNRGNKFAKFSLATSSAWRDEDGNYQQNTVWHKVVVFNERFVDLAEKNLSKGAKIYLEGRIDKRTWQDEGGQNCAISEVVLSDYKSDLQIIDCPGPNI